MKVYIDLHPYFTAMNPERVTHVWVKFKDANAYLKWAQEFQAQHPKTHLDRYTFTIYADERTALHALVKSGLRIRFE